MTTRAHGRFAVFVLAVMALPQLAASAPCDFASIDSPGAVVLNRAEVVREFLAPAMEGRRLVGIEVEFGNTPGQKFLDGVAKHLNGKLFGGALRIDPQSPIREQPKEDGMSFFLKSADGVEHEFFYKQDWDVLNRPGGDWVEGVRSLDEARALVASYRGAELTPVENTHVISPALGKIDLHGEPIGAGKNGIELVTPPLVAPQLPDFYRLLQYVGEQGARGVSAGFAAGVHVNIGVKEGENGPQIARRLILRWSKRRQSILDRFHPSGIRRSPIDDDRPYYGDYPEAFRRDLQALGEGITAEQFLALFDKYEPDTEAKYRGKWFDINPLPLLWGNSRRIEFRLFNSDFAGDYVGYVKDAVAVTISSVEEAARTPYP